MAVTWDQATADAAYRDYVRIPGHPLQGQRIGYGRLWAQCCYRPDSAQDDLFPERWALILASFPIQPTETVLVAGCAYGGLIEAAHAAGFPNVYGCDNSAYMSADTDPSVIVAPIDFSTLGAGNVKNQLKTVTGYSRFDWIIDEDLSTSFTAAEATTGCNIAAGLLNPQTDQSHVLHLVTANANPPFTSLTLAEWKAIAPQQSWTDVRLSEWGFI